jgi:hypothetical protein
MIISTVIPIATRPTEDCSAYLPCERRPIRVVLVLTPSYSGDLQPYTEVSTSTGYSLDDQSITMAGRAPGLCYLLPFVVSLSLRYTGYFASPPRFHPAADCMSEPRPLDKSHVRRRRVKPAPTATYRTALTLLHHTAPISALVPVAKHRMWCSGNIDDSCSSARNRAAKEEVLQGAIDDPLSTFVLTHLSPRMAATILGGIGPSEDV